MSTTTGADTGHETVVPLTGEYPVARVNLLPPEIIEGRALKRAQRWMALSVVGVVAAAGGGYYLAQADAAEAAEELAAERARTAVLQEEAAQFAQVPAILASVDRAETALDTAMAPDIEWYRYLAQFALSAPESVWFRNLTFTAVPAGGTTGDPLAPTDSVAQISTTGRALAYVDVAAWLDALDGVPTSDYVAFTDTTLDEESLDQPFVDFTATSLVAPEALSGRYAPKGE